MKYYIILLFFFIFYSCNSTVDKCEVLVTLENNNQSLMEYDGVIYPLSGKSNSRLYYTDNDLDWVNGSKVVLPDGQQVDLPWVDGNSLPFYMQEKLLPENGWELIAHTMYPETQLDRAYMFFHNYITGTLRVFCYVSTYTSNNNGYWKITFSEPNSLLNFTGELAIPANQSTQSEIIVSNCTTQDSKGYAMGWNGFQLDLAYDSSLSGIMKIEAMNHTTTSITINGDYDSSTTGTIVGTEKTASSASNLIEGVGKLAGNAAEEWLKDKVPFFLKDTSGANTALSLAKKGIGSVFGIFSGLFEKETEKTETLNCTTHGTIEVQGSALTETPAPIVPINIHLNMLNTNLGGWNLSDTPNLFWYTTVFPDYDANSSVTDRMYVYQVPGIQSIDYTINANPKTSFGINDFINTAVGFYGWSYQNEGNMPYGNNAMLGVNPNIYDDGNGNVVKNYNGVKLRIHVAMPEYSTSNDLPPYLNLLETQYSILEYGQRQNTDIYLQVTVDKDFVINGVTNTYVCTRTYKCKHNWGSEY